MQVSIDTALCQGHGRCSMLVPDVFDVDDDGMGLVLTPSVPVGLEGDVQRAVGSCPERAITSLD